MGAAPVDAATTTATPEVIVILTGQRLELLDDFGFGNSFQESIAVKAAGERRQSSEEIKSTQNLDGLLCRILRAGMKSGSHD
jgi:hypothetical protein